MTLALSLTCLPASSPREERGEETRSIVCVPSPRTNVAAPRSPFFTGRGYG